MRRQKNPESFAIPEPRIRLIAHDLQRMLTMVELEKDGQVVDIDGFRLRDLSKWVTHETNTAMNALTPISSVCNSRCHFCFEENAPYPRERSLMPLEEAKTRLRYYSPESGASLFPSDRNHMETFIHPQAVEIIELARERQPGKLFWITTNGSHFTEDKVARLAALKPIIFKLSLNVSDPELNRELMGTGKRTETAIEAPRLLQKYGIPFMGSTVAWPTLPLDAIEETVRYLEACEAYAVRIRLPLSHRWLKHQLDVDFDSHWETVAAFAQGLRTELEVPLFVEPPIYWVNPIVPEVDGVVKNSPAYRAGVRPCDVVRAINGEAIRTRIHSEAVLDRLHMAGEETVELQVERGQELLSLRLEDAGTDSGTYPYNPDYFYRGENYGIFHVEDFRLHHIQKLLDVIERYQAHDVLLFSSRVVMPVFEALATGIPEFAAQLEDVTLHVETVDENSFGGNYGVMDSRVVEDYARVVRRVLARGTKLDLILIPDAFGSPWGTDVFGHSYADLAMDVGVPVERIDWLMVYGREV
ncbi:radical SAM protein [Solirubrobacter ginsenosidimutans]|uniref:Radical SAM protein n=1 Tax=Solirubrobacter ginsenosidimutans TaxID=490573 RepID=A0A9X3MTK5_9ACTN|nr:radical SAM protein [Solirubrobacter ginsenosidimutans]MDA0161272.1 radical SAM protein [Solirubrobacter ginsenosidimutans]